jgi:hypothetical protein
VGVREGGVRSASASKLGIPSAATIQATASHDRSHRRHATSPIHAATSSPRAHPRIQLSASPRHHPRFIAAAPPTEHSPDSSRGVAARRNIRRFKSGAVGYRGSIFDRVSWGIEGRPRRFRPAPLRAPPHVRATSRGSRSCRRRADLIPRMCGCRRERPSGCVVRGRTTPQLAGHVSVLIARMFGWRRGRRGVGARRLPETPRGRGGLDCADVGAAEDVAIVRGGRLDRCGRRD